MNANVLRKLICLNCGSPRLSNTAISVVGRHHKDAASETLKCGVCGSVYPYCDGIIDFADTVPISSNLSQWAMEFRPLVTFYEHIWRPMVTKPFSDLDWEIKTVQKLLNIAYGLDVLDLGCGPGNFTRLIADGVKSGVVIGFDLSLPMLKQGLRTIAKTNALNITLMRGDVNRLPFAESSFDRIHCSGALHLFPNLTRVFMAIYNILKPGGLFVAATYCHGGGFVKRQIQDCIAASSGFHWFELQELQDLADEAGFIGWQHFVRKQGIVFCVGKPEMAV
ncbi:MAG: class I SAM-dependent methyltransferase [Syntrophaceae bacterium]|nr:class I SAM-dependent methyltransferase [Syntrophaceae bacterium]